MKQSVIETWEKTGDIPKWKPVVGAMVEVFEDPMTEHKHEGVAKVVNIHSKDNGVLDCDVQFKGEMDIVRRKVKFI